ncbi:hypothetical protein KM043_007062 [Ampulex compressa]|nr:hypothetical protein KM043_007062 [Ampulex compressa]
MWLQGGSAKATRFQAHPDNIKRVSKFGNAQPPATAAVAVQTGAEERRSRSNRGKAKESASGAAGKGRGPWKTEERWPGRKVTFAVESAQEPGGTYRGKLCGG